MGWSCLFKGHVWVGAVRGCTSFYKLGRRCSVCNKWKWKSIDGFDYAGFIKPRTRRS